MIIKLYGRYNAQDAASNLVKILELFHQRYSISGFKDLQLSLTLSDYDGQEVELVDANTSEVLDSFEVCKTGELREQFSAKNDRDSVGLKLVVDNTK
jgi:hypothetical protein